jgi:hypothetical protein
MGATLCERGRISRFGHFHCRAQPARPAACPSEEAAKSFRAFVAALKGLSILPATLDDHARTLRVLDRFRGAKLTYVDAASLGWIEQRKIKTVWSTDHHLGLTGAEILPRS